MLAVAARQWWVLVLQGTLGILFGIVAIASPDIALVTIALLFGAWAILTGLSQLGEGFRVAEARGRSWPFALMGVVAIVAGIIAVFVPGITILGLAILLGWWLVIQGAMEVYTAWRIRREVTGEWVLAIIGVARAIVGAIVLVLPIVGVILTLAVVAVWSIFGGIGALLLGFRLRQFHERSTSGGGGQAATTGA
jgi:uncharacterized membrane protein HdeD (DUF308 family)